MPQPQIQRMLQEEVGVLPKLLLPLPFHLGHRKALYPSPKQTQSHLVHTGHTTLGTVDQFGI